MWQSMGAYYLHTGFLSSYKIPLPTTRKAGVCTTTNNTRNVDVELGLENEHGHVRARRKFDYSLFVKAPQMWRQWSWASKDEKGSAEGGGWGGAFQMEPESLRLIQNRVLFTPESGIKAGEELTPGLTTTWRHEADKKAERFLEGWPASWRGGLGDGGIGAGSCSAQLPSGAGIVRVSRPLPSRRCTTLPGERRITLALSQHFLHDSLCHIPFQGWVGRAHSTHAIISP